MTGFWLAGFSVAAWLFWLLPRGVRYIAGVLWSGLFMFSIVFWAANIGILYYSGLYFSPSALDHAQGSAGVVENTLSLALALGTIVVIGVFLYTIYIVVKAHRVTPRRVWQAYTTALVLCGVGACLGLSSFKNTPERQVLKAFYDRYVGTVTIVTLPNELKKKLERFGLFYQPEQFLVTEHRQIFDPQDCGVGFVSSTKQVACKPLLNPVLQKKTPNLVVIFLESYSARLTGPYNKKFSAVTPGLNAMAADPDTTLFKNYYNASTPTITGIISALCSFLPPTGHNEIQNDRKLQSHRLQCLPEMLKKYAGFTYANYVTAVDKDFAHKDGIFTSMGVDKVYGTTELAQIINGVPLA
jgi:phosphoglycerol transferase MdoB-like AlkP superfamily enzyme